MEAEECPVCLESVRDPVLLHPCRHLFCRACSYRVLLEGGVRCPLCRGIATALTPHSPSLRKGRAAVRLEVDAERGRHAGIRVRDDVRGGFVKVEAAVSQDEASRCGIREGDAILSVNNIPAVHHRDVVAVVQECTDRGHPVTLVLGTSYYFVGSKWRRQARRRAVSFHASRDAWDASHGAIA